VAILHQSSYPLVDGDIVSSFEGCSFTGNSSQGGICARIEETGTSYRVKFSNCTFSDNKGYVSGAAAISCVDAGVEVVQSTIVNTKPYSGSLLVGALSTEYSASVSLRKSVVAFNSGPVIIGSYTNAGCNNSILYGNTPAGSLTDASFAASWPSTYATEDPAFCDAANADYHLYAFSPAAGGANDELGPHFSHFVGALGIGCIPNAIVTVLPGTNIQTYPPNDLLFCCPGGDGDTLQIQVRLQDNHITRSIAANELSIQPPYQPAGIFSPTVIKGDVATGVNADRIVTIGHKYLTGYGTDNVPIYLNGYPLATALVKRRGPDLKTTSPACDVNAVCPDGRVELADFAYWSTAYPTTANPNPEYKEQCDFNGDNSVGLGDWSMFAMHYPKNPPHTFPSGTSLFLAQNGPSPSPSPAHVALSFTDEYLTAVTRRLYVDLSLEEFAGVTFCVFALEPHRGDVTFREWQPGQWASGQTLFASAGLDSTNQLTWGVIVDDASVSARHLGRLVFDVSGTDPIVPGEDDFVLVAGDIATGGSGEAMAFGELTGVLGRTLDTAVQHVFHTRLEQNFPNPFNPQTILAYSLKDASNVSLTIYDVGGRRVRDLVHEHRAPGAYRVVWDGRDGNGTQVASGVYFYKIIAGSFVETKKMVMLK
jgi:hypothetical protein